MTSKVNLRLFGATLFISVAVSVFSVGRILAKEQVGDVDPVVDSLAAVFRLSAEQLETNCREARERLDQRLGEIVAGTGLTLSPILEFETAMSHFSDQTTPLTFMGYVSMDAVVRDKASQCEEDVGKFLVDVFTRKPLYEALRSVRPDEAAQRRLYDETLKAFEKNGLMLSDEQREEARRLKTELAGLETDFSKNLNEDVSTVEFTAEELTGVSSDFLNRLRRTTEGKYLVTTKSTDYLQVSENAQNPETRRRMLLAYNNRAAQTNTALLEQAVTLRQQIARVLGSSNWVDYRTQDRMARNSGTITNFLNGLRNRLAEKNQQDLAELLEFKRTLDPTATRVEAWDVNYLANQLKKVRYSVDTEAIREYFPKDHVMQGVFDVYSEILSVEYHEVPNAPVWNDQVKLYEVRNRGESTPIAYFYTDLSPREGKYGHAAAFPLIAGKMLNPTGASDRGYTVPVASIVANFNPPTADKPSLLSHDEVETLFHEFGHIMHQILTRAPFATLSGTNVAQDFVEAPSQMLENWVWNEEVLQRISGHYTDVSQKLPQDVLRRMLALKNFNTGYFYTRQLLFGIFDMTIHLSEGPVDVTATFDRLYREIQGIEPIAGSHFAATFGHLMGGYDAGYYGYLWSEVYAQDMFTAFESGGLLSPEVGARYRNWILERGNTQDALSLVEGFLGRPSNNEAFFRKLGITPDRTIASKPGK